MKKRGRNLVLRKFQTWFLTRLFLFALAFCSLILIGFTIWFRSIFEEILSLSGLLSNTYLELLIAKAERGFWILCSISVSLLFITTYFGFLFSAKIAGPVYALLRHFEKCRDQSQLLPMKLRQDDQLRELAEKFNEMANRVSQEGSSRGR